LEDVSIFLSVSLNDEFESGINCFDANKKAPGYLPEASNLLARVIVQYLAMTTY